MSYNGTTKYDKTVLFTESVARRSRNLLQNSPRLLPSRSTLTWSLRKRQQQRKIQATESRIDNPDSLKKMQALFEEAWFFTAINDPAGLGLCKRLDVLDVLVVTQQSLLDTYLRSLACIRMTAANASDFFAPNIEDLSPTLSQPVFKTGFEPLDAPCDVKVNEIYLFHGTDVDKADRIITEGFSVDREQPGVYGKGVYMAESAEKADQHAGGLIAIQPFCLNLFLPSSLPLLWTVSPS